MIVLGAVGVLVLACILALQIVALGELSRLAEVVEMLVDDGLSPSRPVPFEGKTKC